MNEKDELNSTILKNGVALFYPKGIRISSKREKIFLDLCDSLSVTFGNVWKIFLNPDLKREGEIYGMNVVFYRRAP